VEVFELDARKGMPSLTWIGCAVAPMPIGLNSVRWLADGGFVATNFNPRGAGPDAFKRLQAGERNGEVWEWHTASGWQKVPGSEASGANGIEISDDGRTLYVAEWGTRSVIRLSRGQGTPTRDLAKLDFNVDNIHWAADGTLFATGQDLDKRLFVVAKVDPKTLVVREVLRQSNTPAFGNGTVAVEVGKDLWVGSFQGDRLAIFPLPK
jgi:sugar lactone lactonase YvrE